MSKAIEFLKSIGVPEQVVTALESADDSLDISTLVGPTETHFTEFYKNKVKDEIHRTGKGAGYAEAITAVKKQFGITEAEVKGLDFQGVLKIVDERLKEKTGNKELVEQLNQAKQNLIEFENKVKEYEETVIPAVRGEAETAIKSFKVNQAIQSELVKHPLIGASQYVVPGFTQDFTKKYKVEVDDNGHAIVTDLNGAKVYDSSKKEMTLTDLIILEGKQANIFKASNADPANPPAPNPGVGSPPAPQPKGNNSMAKWKEQQRQLIEEQKKALGVQ